MTPANDRAEWLAANRYAHDDDIDPSDADVDPVTVTAEQVAEWRAGYEAALRDRGVAFNIDDPEYHTPPSRPFPRGVTS